MDNYEWQKNKAIVDRMYYAERVFTTSTIGATLFTGLNIVMLRNAKFSQNTMRARLLPTLKWYIIFNVVTIGLLLRPLQKAEIKQ